VVADERRDIMGEIEPPPAEIQDPLTTETVA
jgi:hypothetical protein